VTKQLEAEERQETALWSKGAKSATKAEAEEAKKAAAAQKKAELKAIEVAERASLPSKPSAKVRGDEKKAVKRAGNLDDLFAPKMEEGAALAASNIDDALDALSLAQGGGERGERKALAGIDRHPEKRLKAALAAFEDRRLPELRQEHPGLRLQQYKDILYKEFQKVAFPALSLPLVFGVRANAWHSHRTIRLIRFMLGIMLREMNSGRLLLLRNGRLNNGLRRKLRSKYSLLQKKILRYKYDTNTKFGA
jgi:hypothetical protein